MQIMDRQMDIFDFIEKPTEKLQQHTLFDRIFPAVERPAIICANCLCNYCTHNVEGKVKPEEFSAPCFNCDECYQYDGNPIYRIRIQKDCHEFTMSDYGANRNRKRIRMVKKYRWEK